MTASQLGICVWTLGVIAWFVIRFPYARKARRTATVRSHGWSRERILLAVATFGLVVVPVIWLSTGWPSALNYDLSYAAVTVGAAVFLLSLWLFRRSHEDLGRQWSASLEIREGHQIVRNGVYSRIRHPMYTSFWLWALAQALLLPNTMAAMSGLVAIGILFFTRIDFEERMLIEAFGEDYRTYMRETKRIIPGIY
ncbi:isoprenylcysteine carboxylmethyltransferase family protein [Tardiphaga sp. vice352]|uniref:protein-S-isoprenylcysteine O-methyltransferase n=1 Tax=unclassified Tardiphaga TaxID=2631404 RepID=UPI0011653700|nr:MULTISPECIES: protein-S-isoprenylcysteine O-methyltransferase [unclassified Tardiphaga]MBC7582476.1 isoprenylcysteine carboxylmethyltransferase family protein [Tardiphaga sp.]QDM16962.1 isoprenylcysteine carboxylmethyltransferase family protein [Tardiphaga sp. vice278]QDM21944.1 isoprenylcysteine carboxylmethyltransferase family protein [Tardiphaga sp. vice154]QDM27198.1 isoprenylcysteine carboxylmethyltransferase family protein [Tardiphaga sp. vice304]QDM32323.1 isoprenylcysteine carboxylm